MSVDDPLAELRASKLPELMQRADVLSASLRCLASDGSDTAGAASPSAAMWADIRATAHQLAGVLATLGFVQSGRLAVELEDVVAGTQGPNREVLGHLVELSDGIVEGLKSYG